MSEHGRALNEQEQSLFKDFFSRLQRQQIPFVVLRNYEDFPEYIGHDLDLFIPRQDAPMAKSIFYEVLVAAKATVLISHERDYYFDIRFVLNGPATNAIHLDLYHGSFTWHSLHYLSEETLLKQAREFNGMKIPRPAHEAFNIFFASILWGGFYKFRYQPQIAALLAVPEERAEFDRCTQAAFGPAGSPPFDPCSSSPPPASQVHAYAKRLRSAFKRKCFRRAPLRTMMRLARHWFVESGCLMRPKGLVIALIPSGEINTNVTTEVIGRIGDLFCENQVYRIRPQNPPPERGVGLYRLVKEWAKCWLRWPLRGWKKKAQTQLVILERYTEDWWHDPAPYGFNRLPQWLLKAAASLTPQPDLTFVLEVDGQVSPKDRLKPHARRFFVNATQPASAVADCIEGGLVAYLQKREPSK